MLFSISGNIWRTRKTWSGWETGECNQIQTLFINLQNLQQIMMQRCKMQTCADIHIIHPGLGGSFKLIHIVYVTMLFLIESYEFVPPFIVFKC